MSQHSKTPQLNQPSGSVYFSQMHSLRWRDREESDCLDRLYTEILRFGIQNTSLIVTDSHALQNSWLRTVLANEKRYRGLKDLFTEGVILIAKRGTKEGDAIPLTETVQTQIGSAPVVIEKTETVMTPDFTEHANNLEFLAASAGKKGYHAPVYDTKVLDLGKRMKRALSLPDVYKNYDITDGVAADLLDRFSDFLNKEGLFMARKLFSLPDDPKAPDFIKERAKQIKDLATSVHSCNFALSYHIAPSTSTSAFDHNGAMRLYRDQLPEYDFLPEFQEEKQLSRQPPSQDSLPSIYLTPSIVLRIRESDYFLNYLQARDYLFKAYQRKDAGATVGGSKAFAEASLEYVHHILKTLDISATGLSQDFRYHLTRLKKATNEDNPLLVWAQNLLMPGHTALICAVQEQSDSMLLSKARETSTDILLSTNRILNLM